MPAFFILLLILKGLTKSVLSLFLKWWLHGLLSILSHWVQLSTRETSGVWLEFWPMPALSDKAHDGVLRTFSTRQPLNLPEACCCAGSRPGQASWQVACTGPSQPKISTGGSLSSSQPGGPPCWASPLVFGLIVLNHTIPLSVFLTVLHHKRWLCSSCFCEQSTPLSVANGFPLFPHIYSTYKETKEDVIRFIIAVTICITCCCWSTA